MKPQIIQPLPNGLTFNVIDVETANHDRAICQIGVVQVVSGSIRGEWSTLVNPEADFDPYHVDTHGIGEEKIRDAPILPDIWDDLRNLVDNHVLISHSPYDRDALSKAAYRYDMNWLSVRWYDSVTIARNAWPKMPGKHSLKNLADQLGIQFDHHDALEDARAAAIVVLKAYGQA